MNDGAPQNEFSREIEVLLFAYGEPLTPEKIAKILGEIRGSRISAEEAEAGIAALQERLAKEEHGLMLMRTAEGVQLATKPFGKAIIEHLTKQELNENLTPAAVETLAIIAYLGPVPRSTIDYIRGVNSSFILRTLLIRGLVSREADPGRANAYRYSASLEFLKHIGLGEAAELPDYAAFKEAVNAMQAELAKTVPAETSEAKAHEQI